MKRIEEMTLKEKDILLKAIIREYQKAKLQLTVIKEKDFYPRIRYDLVKEGNTSYRSVEDHMIHFIDKKDDLESLVHFIETVFNELDFDQYQLLENDYLHPSYKDWWLEFYSRSTYYRLRRKMLDEVLFYLTR